LEYLREDPKRLVLAGEEFFRVFMPLTHIGRVCPLDTTVHGVPVKAGGRVSLGSGLLISMDSGRCLQFARMV
jgi:cytochrome P450